MSEIPEAMRGSNDPIGDRGVAGYFKIVGVASCEDGDCAAKIKHWLWVHVSDPFSGQAGVIVG
jgi:hypothetical protein